MNYVDFNASAWDAIASPGKEDGRACFTLPISHEDYLQAQKARLRFLLLPQKKCLQIGFLRFVARKSLAWQAVAASRDRFLLHMAQMLLL